VDRGDDARQHHPRFTNATYVVQQAELDHVRGGPTYE
jgi:hypothetical protein